MVPTAKIPQLALVGPKVICNSVPALAIQIADWHV